MRLSRILFCFLFWGSTLGQAAPAESPTIAAKQSAPFQIFMQLELHPKLEVGRRSLLPGETAHTGDRFGIKVWADQPVYLYVVSFSKDGWSRRLFPAAGDKRVPAGEKTSLPLSGNLYLLHDPPEENTLYLFASAEPLDAANCALLRLRCTEASASTRNRGSGETKPPPPPPPPAGRSAREREGQMLFDNRERFVSVKSDFNGTALLRFSFKQEP